MNQLFSQKTFSTALLLVVFFFLSSCGGQSGSSSNSAPTTPATLTGIQISPYQINMANHSSLQLQVVAAYSDNSTLDITNQINWSLQHNSIAAINSSGSLTATAAGSTVITASYLNQTATANLTVSSAVLTSVSISPATVSITQGAEYQFTASAHYSDGTSHDITQQANWSVNNSNSQLVTGVAGRLRAIYTGSTVLQASVNGISDTALVTITDAIINRLEISSATSNIAAGSTLQLQATAIFSNATSQPVTDQVLWQSSDQSIASVDSNGLLTGHSSGSVTITSTHNTSISQILLSISNATLSRIEITAATQNLAAGISQLFFATGIYSDNSSQDISTLVSWNSSQQSVAIIDNGTANKGLCTALANGQTSITASLADVSASKALTVTDAVLTDIEIFPSEALISNGLAQVYTALGHFSDGSISDITNQASWSTSDDAVAASNISQPSVIQSFVTGNVTVSANINGLFGFSRLTINDAVLTAISIEQTDITIAKGSDFQFTVSGTYSDGSVQDLSEQVIWQSDISATATIQNDQINKGLASGILEGTTTITATYNSFESSTTLTVTPAILTSISLSSTSTQLLAGHSLKITATAIYSDDSMQDISDSVTWHSSANNLASISNADLNKGEVTGYAAGSVNITATVQQIQSSAFTLAVLLDPDAPLSISSHASPNVILNNASDSSTISAIVQPTGSAGVIADGTSVVFQITENNITRAVTVPTTNGIATHTLASTTAGIITVSTSIDSTDISSTSTILSTNDFSDVLQKAEYINADYANGVFLTGSQLGLLAINLSNRSFIIDELRVLNGTTDFPNTPVAGSDINSGLIDSGDNVFVLLRFSSDITDNGITAEFFFSDILTGSQLRLSYDFTFTQSVP